jgi:hypothetical protein
MWPRDHAVVQGAGDSEAAVDEDIDEFDEEAQEALAQGVRTRGGAHVHVHAASRPLAPDAGRGSCCFTHPST